MRKMQTICDKCKIREAVEMPLYRTRGVDAAGSVEDEQYSIDICDPCLQLLFRAVLRSVPDEAARQIHQEFVGSKKWEQFFKWDVELGEERNAN